MTAQEDATPAQEMAVSQTAWGKRVPPLVVMDPMRFGPNGVRRRSNVESHCGGGDWQDRIDISWAVRPKEQ